MAAYTSIMCTSIAAAHLFALLLTTSTLFCLSCAMAAVTSSDVGESTVCSKTVEELKAQVNALMERRSEDFSLLEASLRASLEKSLELGSLREEVQALRQQVSRLRAGTQAHNEHVTAHWVTSTMRAVRADLTQLWSAVNVSAQRQHRQEVTSWISQLRADVTSLRSELSGMRADLDRGQGVINGVGQEVREARTQIQHVGKLYSDLTAKLESAQSEWTAGMRQMKKSLEGVEHIQISHSTPPPQAEAEEDNEVIPQATHPHRTRHQRLWQRAGRRLDALTSKVSALEHAGLGAGSGLDKLHLSLLQLLEKVEVLEGRVATSLPDLRAELSKLEFAAARAQADMAVAKEEQENQRITVQALAGGQSALQHQLSVLRQQVNTSACVCADPGNTLEAPPELNNSTSDNSSTALVLLSELTRVHREYREVLRRLPADCSVMAGPDGLYLLSPDQESPILAYCTRDPEDGDTWTVVQRRQDGREDFNRGWQEYVRGFGSPAGEFWLGNEALHRLTKANCTSLRVDLRDIYGRAWTASYTHFSVSSSTDGYRLHVSGYTGNASDALDYQNGMRFSAVDVDNDISATHCAANYEGGWWFSHCQHANLNGRYNLGLTWFDAGRNEWIAVAWSEMKLRPRRHCS